MKTVFLCLCASIIAVFPNVQCRQINYGRSVRSVSETLSDDTMEADVEDEFTTQMYIKNDKGMNVESDNNDTVEDKSMNTAFPPEGAGLFRDPMDVLGHKFSPLLTVNICEVLLHQHADEISDIKFTGRGNKTCMDVCVQYRQNMKLDGPMSVDLVENYCDYTGSTTGYDSDNWVDLTTTCTCLYKLRCNSRSRVIMYIFEANCKGFLKVSVTEVMKKNCIS